MSKRREEKRRAGEDSDNLITKRNKRKNLKLNIHMIKWWP